MTQVGDIIQPGESIPDDVLGLRSRKGGEFVLNELGHWHMPEWADPKSCVRDEFCGYSAADFAKYGPLTVTAVREPEPQQADVSALLDLVRQLRNMLQTDAVYTVEADELLARIDELVPQQPDPLVLSLPEVPEGAVALRGGIRWLPSPDDPEAWCMEGGSVPYYLGRLLDAENGSVTVEMAPPREPRTWPKLDGAPGDVQAVKDCDGDVWTRGSRGSDGTQGWIDEGADKWCSFTELQERYGPLTEVFDDEPGGTR
jgi:hypothetical protein